MNSRNLGASGSAPSLAYRFVERVLSKEHFVLQLSGPCIGLLSSGIFRYLMIAILCLGAPLPVRACSGLSGVCLCPKEVVSSNVLVALGAAHYYLTWGWNIRIGTRHFSDQRVFGLVKYYYVPRSDPPLQSIP